MAHTQKSVPLEAKTLDLPDKDFKVVLIKKMLQGTIINTLGRI